MGHTKYTAVPVEDRPSAGWARGAEEDDGGDDRRRPRSWYERARQALFTSSLVTMTLILGFCLGREHEHRGIGGVGSGMSTGGANGLLSPQAFVPEVPMKEVTFDFPTPYENTSVEGDKLWDALMPIGSGFIRVPYPRQYDMPASKAIDDDPEEAEIYSLSVLHQLHCLGVIRDVIKKYEKHDKSRFAGEGHEYHCIDYIRQSVMCSGDTTLDYAELHEDGTRRGFSGAGSKHQCRDWDAIVDWAVENRVGDKKGIA